MSFATTRDFSDGLGRTVRSRWSGTAVQGTTHRRQEFRAAIPQRDPVRDGLTGALSLAAGPGAVEAIMLPCAEGGIGRISRAATLASALRRIDSSVECDCVLDAVRLRPLDIEMTSNMDYRPRPPPALTRDNRDAVTKACLGDADAISRREPA